MSAMPSQLPQSIDPAGFDLAGFIPAAEAAEKLGVNADALGRKCHRQLEARGLAIKLTSPETGQSQWHVLRSYDPRLAGDGQDRGGVAGLEALTGKRRDFALQRADAARRYRHERINSRELKAAWLPKLKAALLADYPKLGTLSRSTLDDWDRKSNGGRNPMALADHRGGHQAPEASAEAWKAFEDLYLHQNQPTIRQVWKLIRSLAAESGWQWVSYSRCRKLVNRKISPEKQAFHRMPETHRKQLAPYIPQHPESFEAGECFIGDHKEFDVICRLRGSPMRAWATVWMDWRSRKIVGSTVSAQPNSITILGALKMAIEAPDNLGLPKLVKVDNGRDYDARIWHGQSKLERRARISPRVDEPSARGILGRLGIEASFADPFNPNGKARLERWFRTLESFFKTFDSYTGNGVDTKPARLNEILQNPRMIPSFETVAARFADHVAGYNFNAEHSMEDLAEDGVKLSPADAYARWHGTRRVLADPASLDLLMQMTHPPVAVTRRGIGWTFNGARLHHGQYEPALSPFKALSKGERRLVNITFDPNHLETIRVYDEQWTFVCTAEMNQVGGQTGALCREHVAAMNRDKALYNRSLRHVAEHSLTQQLSTEERLADVAARDREARAIEDAIQPMRLVHTPLDGQAAEVRRDEIRGALEPSGANGKPAAAMDPFAMLRKNPEFNRPPNQPKRRKEIDPYELLRKRFA
ncbi:MAG: DDE-type integrase/transposase/recombinase [Tepidisphaeraceae bacterium]|jgi:transposase InsO family protein